jgi:hypothetical protein
MGWPFFFSFSPTSRSSSSVRGQVVWPTSSNQDLRYAIWTPTMLCGSATQRLPTLAAASDWE